MKKIVVCLISLLLIPVISAGEVNYLKMRASHHPGYLRVVLEGQDSVISKALVYQKGPNILVNFPDTEFSVITEDLPLTVSKHDRHTVLFNPGDFRGLKVFTLKSPTRLVIDVYLRQKNIPAPQRPSRDDRPKPDPVKIRTVILDPGHGGYEYGLVKDEYIEKNIVLDISQKLSALINRGSSRSYLTRGSDRILTQKERADFTKSRGADIYLSIHIGNHSGVVIYVPVVTERTPGDIQPYLYNKGQREYMGETVTLMNQMKKALVADFGYGMVTVKPLPYSLLSQVEAAALMIELPSFDDAYYIEDLRTEMANTLYKGLYFYEETKQR